ncbi:MAG: hypothetical protein KY455_10035 [Euryarchaeota archaeon]|nr:hypothetical protein [Euryarchaeota archaeon]
MSTQSTPGPDAPNTLLFLTTVSAMDGTVFLLAAQGAFSHLAGAVTAGLTVVAGGGAWTTAWAHYGGRRLGRSELWRFALNALLGTLLTTLAVLLGSTYGAGMSLRLLPHAAGLGLILLGLQVAGFRLPRPYGLTPIPTLLATTAALEVLLHWTL